MARGKHEAAKKSEKTKPVKKPKRSGGAKKAVLIIAVVCVLLAAEIGRASCRERV